MRPDRPEVDRLTELLRRAYELRRTAPGGEMEGRVLAEIARDPRIVFRYERARQRYRIETSSCRIDSVLVLTIHRTRFKGVPAFLNLFEKCTLGYMRDQAREIAGVKRLRESEQAVLDLIRSEFPRASNYKNLATFMFNCRAVVLACARRLLGLREDQVISAIKGLSAKRGLTRVELDEARAIQGNDDPLDILCSVDSRLLVRSLAQHGVIRPSRREHLESLLEIRFTREDLVSSKGVSELAADQLGGTAAEWSQRFHRFRNRLIQFLAQRYPGMDCRAALERYIEEEIK